MTFMGVLVPHITSHFTSDGVLERVRSLAFAGDHHAALELLKGAPSTPELRLWTGMMHIFLGNLETASRTLTTALAQGYRGAVGPLASIDRLQGRPRYYLETVTRPDAFSLEPFEATMLLREIGQWHLELEHYSTALSWLEAAWTTALTGPYGDAQLPGIATPLASGLARLGFDARATSVLDEGLRRCNRHRRVPLLYERLMCNLRLGRHDAVDDDLAELETCPPRGNDDLPLLVRYAQGRTLHALGAVTEARTAFELCFTFGSVMGSAVARDTALHAALWCAALETERDGAGVEGWLERAGALSANARGDAWIKLRRGRWLSSLGRHAEAEGTLARAVDRFETLEARVELGLALLHRADALLRDGIDREDEAGAELLHASRIALEIGGAAPFQLELRNLLAVRTYLSRSHVVRELKALLESSHSYQRVTVREGRLEIGGVRRTVSADTAQLVTYLHRHPMSSWAHLRSSVYSDLDDTTARSAFERSRTALEDIADLRVTFNARGHAYSLAWSAVSLEVIGV
jgi:hypothetical protein